jgi:hypothetical protein
MKIELPCSSAIPSSLKGGSTFTGAMMYEVENFWIYKNKYLLLLPMFAERKSSFKLPPTTITDKLVSQEARRSKVPSQLMESPSKC